LIDRPGAGNLRARPSLEDVRRKRVIAFEAFTGKG